MGHAGYFGLSEATRVVDGIKLTAEDFIVAAKETKICGDCMVGGQTRLPRPAHTTAKAEERGERVHMDVCGPMKVEGMDGERYSHRRGDAAFEGGAAAYERCCY